MKLKESQITLIEKDLHRRGVVYDELREDIVDHVCCEVEARMENGLSFIDAYNEVVNKFEKRGLPELNKETATLLNFTTMTQSFFTTAFRILRKSWTYSAIRVFGLSLGISVFLLSLMYLLHENSFDSFHQEADQIYRIGRVVKGNKVATTTFPLVPALKVDYPQLQFTHFFKDRSNVLLRKDDKMFFEERMIFADEYFTQFFSFKGFKGNPRSALADPYSVVMTEEVSQKYFGRPAELGEVIDFKWNGAYYPLKITGLIPEWPPNMHIKFDILISFATTDTVFPKGITEAWDMNYCYSYVKLPEGVSPVEFQNSFEAFVSRHVKDEGNEYQSYLGFLQPLTLVHTQPDVISGYTNSTDPDYPRLAVVIGFLVLFITTINFITLTIAQFQERAKEVGIRKAVGATRRQVIAQFVIETFILVTVSFLVGVGLLYLITDMFNQFMMTELTFSIELLSWIFWSLPLLIILLTLITGLYPAVFFTDHNIMDTIHLKKRKAGLSLRKALLTVQYVIAATLITFCIVIFNQVDYVRNKPLGYDKDQILYIPHGRSIRDNPETFKTMAYKNPAIENISLSFYKPTDNVGNLIKVKIDGQEPVRMAATSVDEDFFNTFKIEFVQGSTFTKEAVDQSKVFILNQAAVKYLQLQDPLNTTIDTEFQTGDPNMPVENRVGKVVGVIKDVHFESMHSEIKPMIFMVKPYWYFYINVRVNSQNIPSAISHLEKTWKELFPDLPFEYSFLDAEFEHLYEKEEKLVSGLGMMALLAVLTTCLGLFGYMRYMAQQKTKEVGIRKVLGAGLLQISTLFSREFVMAFMFANVISIPLAYYVASQWLQDFSYRIDISFIPFLLTFIMLLLISILTIVREIVKMINIDPSAILRYD